MREEKPTAVEGCFFQIKQEIRTFIHSIFKWNILNIAEAEAEIFVQCFLTGKASLRVPF